MKKEITIRTLNIKVFILSLILIIPLVFLVAKTAVLLNNTVNQTYFTISCLSVITLLLCLGLKKTSKLIIIKFENNFLTIIDEINSTSLTIFNSKVKNYSIYYLLVKNTGYILRIKSDKEYYYWVIPEGINVSYEKGYLFLIDMLNKKLKHLFKKTNSDQFILAISSIPLIVLMITIVVLIGLIYYIFFLI